MTGLGDLVEVRDVGYVAQGGDQGAAVTDAIGRQAPEGVIGIHTNVLVLALGARPRV